MGASLVVLAVLDSGSRPGERLPEIEREARSRGVSIEIRVESGDPVEVIRRVSPSVGATGVVVADDQWRGRMPHPCVCAPLITGGSLPVMVIHASRQPSADQSEAEY